MRHSEDKKNNLLFVINFTPMDRPDYRVGVIEKKKYKLVLDSDDPRFGGNGREKKAVYEAEEGECDGKPCSISYPLSPYGVAVFKF